MFTGKLEAIYVGVKAAEPMAHFETVQVEAALGIVGDRYATGVGTFAKPGVPDYELTMIEAEAIEAVQHEYEMEISAAETRRNLVTRDVPLNHLVGTEFRVGNVLMRGVRLCEPCAHLQKLTGKDLVKVFAHRGGLRVQVLSSGEISVGDEIRKMDPTG